MRFTKSILGVGKHHSPDGVLDVTPARLKHWAKQHARLTAANQIIPIDWDHPASEADMKPLSLAEYKKKRSAKTTVGKLAKFDLAADGQSATLTFDVPDKLAQQKAADNIIFASPIIAPHWQDGDGNRYEDCIVHADFVNHPVDAHQGPFVPEAVGTIACAIRLGLSKPYRMSEDSPVDDDKDDDDSQVADDDAAADADDEPKDEPVADENRIKAVIEQLAGMNIVLSPDTTPTNFLTHLHQALLTAAAHSGDDDEPAQNGGQSDMTQQTSVADPGPTALSLEQRGAIEWAQQTHRTQVTARLKKVFDDGQCTPAEFKVREAAPASIRLSLDASGKPASSTLEQWLESREAVPKGTFWTDEAKLRMSAASVADPPANMTGMMSDEEAKRVADWALNKKANAAT